MEPLHEQGRWLPVTFVLVWSSAYVAGAVATSLIAPLTLTLWRFALAAALLAWIARRRGERWPGLGWPLARAALTGVLLFALQFGPLYLGLREHMPAATTALIACSAPLLVASLSAAIGWEQLSARRWGGVALGLIGVVITLCDRLGRPPSLAALAWTLLGLAGLVSGTMLQGRLRDVAGPAALGCVELAASAVVMAIVAPLAGPLTIPLTVPALLSFAYIAIVAGAFGPLLLFALIRERGATQASSLLFVVPSVTALLAWPVLGAPLGPMALLGFAIAGAGLWLARARDRRPSPRIDTRLRELRVDLRHDVVR